MRGARLVLLFAAGLLCVAEIVSLSLLIRGIANHQETRERTAMDQAALLQPRVAEWVRSRGGLPGEVLNAAWIEPFDQLVIEDFNASALDATTKARLRRGELVVFSRISEPVASVFGFVSADPHPILIRLARRDDSGSRPTTDRVLLVQHILILIAGLLGLGLVLIRERETQERSEPAIRAYEEAMARLRLRDDERVAAFDRERSRLTETLKDRETMARAGELTAGIVHEVRNSLGAISANANLLAKSTEPGAHAAAAAIGEEIRTLQSAMTRFLDFVRTEKVQRNAFDLRKLVERIASRERANTGSRVVASGESTAVFGDEDLLERALENVVRNAAQATRGSGEVEITFGADAESAFVIVRDEGPGIEDVSKALRPFESSRPGGLGLGLPLVVKILSLHNGSLDLARSPSGPGTQAIVRWPIAAMNATKGSAPSR